ncbi:MAG: T9SS type A sorting domain-containing protein, partial [Bacteroidales bacterium]|nr:T9SS type A sorting domain-containing protein [Bacteroidales bacterium]
LAIQRTALNHYFPWWEPEAFVDNVGDVNTSGNLSSLDAMQVKQRTVYLISSFNAGDWAFWDENTPANFINTGDNIANTAYIHSGTTTLDIKVMCYGDVNGSYLPASSKSLLAVQSEGVLDVLEDKVFQLPVQLMGDHEIGAMSVFLSYPDNILEVTDLKSEIPGFIYQIEDGWINVAWSDLQPINIAFGGTLFTLDCTADKEVNNYGDLFMVSSETQFANMDCKVLDNVILNINKLNVKFKDGVTGLGDMYALSCFPNPVKHLMNIVYTLPENGQVEITIINSLGDIVTRLVDNPQEAGNYNLNFDPGQYGLATGVYYCRMLVQGENSSFNEVVRIVYMK